jgi:hypothetical protein
MATVATATAYDGSRLDDYRGTTMEFTENFGLRRPITAPQPHYKEGQRAMAALMATPATADAPIITGKATRYHRSHWRSQFAMRSSSTISIPEDPDKAPATTTTTTTPTTATTIAYSL